MRQEHGKKLAEKAGLSRSHLSAIEAPNMVRGMSMEIFFNICDTLGMERLKLFNSECGMRNSELKEERLKLFNSEFGMRNSELK